MIPAQVTELGTRRLRVVAAASLAPGDVVARHGQEQVVVRIHLGHDGSTHVTYCGGTWDTFGPGTSVARRRPA